MPTLTHNIYQTVQSRQAEFAALYARMDADRDLYHLKRYHMTNPVDGHAIPNIVNVTLSDPKLFIEKALAIMAKASMQTEVTGEGLSDQQTTTIEGFLEAAYLLIDQRLSNRGIPSLSAFVDEQLCLRGRAVARCLVRRQGEGVIFDVAPFDARSTCYDYNATGLSWAAAECRRTRAQLLEEYGVETAEKSQVITDVWTAGDEIVYLAERELRHQPHGCGYVPFVISQVPVGSMFSDSDAFEYAGESLFAPNRTIYPELNRLATVLQNEIMAGWMGAMQYESEAGAQAARPVMPPYGVRVVLPVEKDGGYKAMPHESVVDTARFMYTLLDSRKQEGSFAATDYGNLAFPLAAVTVGMLSAAKDDRMLPRIQAKAVFYQQLSQMIIKQFIASDIPARLAAGTGQRVLFTPAELAGDYEIKYRFFATSVEKEMSDYAIATAAQPFISADTIRRDILKLQDPDGENARIKAERDEAAAAIAAQNKKGGKRMLKDTLPGT